MLEHPDGIEALKNLLDLYLLQGKNEQAELLLLNALHIREGVLAINHPIVVMLQQKNYELHQNSILKSGVDQ